MFYTCFSCSKCLHVVNVFNYLWYFEFYFKYLEEIWKSPILTLEQINISLYKYDYAYLLILEVQSFQVVLSVISINRALCNTHYPSNRNDVQLSFPRFPREFHISPRNKYIKKFKLNSTFSKFNLFCFPRWTHAFILTLDNELTVKYWVWKIS